MNSLLNSLWARRLKWRQRIEFDVLFESVLWRYPAFLLDNPPDSLHAPGFSFNFACPSPTRYLHKFSRDAIHGREVAGSDASVDSGAALWPLNLKSLCSMGTAVNSVSWSTASARDGQGGSGGASHLLDR